MMLQTFLGVVCLSLVVAMPPEFAQATINGESGNHTHVDQLLRSGRHRRSPYSVVHQYYVWQLLSGHPTGQATAPR